MEIYDLILFAGQSNMAGRGIVTDKWPQKAPVLVKGAGYEYRAITAPDRLCPIEEPFGADENNPDGIFEPGMKTGSMVTAFVNEYYKLTHIPVLAVSASKGGSSISEWQGNNDFLSDAIARYRKATEYAQKNHIEIRHKYVLWCQGETDGDRATDIEAYGKLFINMFSQLQGAGICSGVADDTNIFNYWVRSHGEQLFSDDNKSLGYDDDQILVDYLDMWKDLMDCDAEPDPDEYTQIQSLGQEAGPVVTGDAAMLNENNNYASKMSSANPNLKVTIPPVSDINKKAIWNKPSYMLCISEKSKVKKEAAEFINWFINSEESNDIMMAERGVPSPQNIRDHLLDSGKLNEKQQEMFEYADQVVEYTGDTPDPDPMGISEVSKSLQDCAYSAFYGNITTKEAAEKFRKEANEILERNN